MIYSGRSELDLSDENIRFQNFRFSQKLWWKNCWKWPKVLRCRKVHSFQTINILSKIWIAQIQDLNEDCVKMLCPYLLYFPRNKASKSVTVGSGRFIVLNNSASPKMVEIYFNFFLFFLKILELFGCRRGDPYMTANRNFVRFAHS